jgi:uncharacterized protein YndB with AHSA1/START domain
VTRPEPAAAIVERVLPAPPAVVYQEWLDPHALADWMCPRPAHATDIQLDPTVGGRLRIEIDDNGVHYFVVGRYLDLDPPTRISFTWSCSTWANPDHESVVTVTLEPHGADETLMTVRHTLLPEGTTAQHQSGWDQIAAQLTDKLQAVA